MAGLHRVKGSKNKGLVHAAPVKALCPFAAARARHFPCSLGPNPYSPRLPKPWLRPRGGRELRLSGRQVPTLMRTITRSIAMGAVRGCRSR